MPPDLNTDDLPLMPPARDPLIVSGVGLVRAPLGLVRDGPELCWGHVIVRHDTRGRPVARQAIQLTSNLGGAASTIAAILRYAEHFGLAGALSAEIDQALAYYRDALATGDA